jgi:cellulose synthase/poly-beta-1,6-N-acetylglucosamine synthase-like glycosyltransferase
MAELIVYSILGLYLLMHFIMFIGLLINSKKPQRSAYEPKVSVIICARDEESCIADCIKSLLEMDYPKEKLEVVLVNDRSTDRTKEIMMSYVSHNPLLKYYEVTQTTGKLKGKANALMQALKQATGEVIFTTDADIEVNRHWVREILKYYKDNTGVAAGYSVIIPKNFFYGLQSADWLYLLSVASGGDGIGVPISCVGNNMSYLHKAYNEIGGYEKIPFSITEDFMLLQKIHKEGGYKTRFPVNDKTKNITLPCLTITQLLRQKKRWAAGGIGELNFGMLIGLFSWLTGAVILAGWAFLSLETYLAFFITKLAADSIFLFPAIKEFKMYKVYLYMIFFEVYFAVYVIITSAMLAVDRKVIWKDQKI